MMLDLFKLRFLRKCLLLTTLAYTLAGYAQDRLVLPGQELLYPNLTDPSFVGEEGRTQITAVGQFVDFDSDRSSQYINAQLPLYDNLSFGVDYYNNRLDYHRFSQVLLTAAFEIPVGGSSYVKIGLSGGGESYKIDQIPVGQQTPNLVPNINENNISFTYRAGLHFKSRNLLLGGYYTTLPSQQISVQTGQEDLLNFNLLDGFTGYLGYRLPFGQSFALTPMFRYLSFTDDGIYEGSVKLQLKDKIDLTMAYRNDYSINPALRFQFFKSLLVGYSYEKAIGQQNFEDIHSFGLSYKFNKSNADEEPEWMETAKENIEKTDAITEPKPKKENEAVEKTVETEGTPEDETEVLKETIEAEVPQKPIETKPEVDPKETVADEPVEETKVAIKTPSAKAVTIVMSSRFYIVAKSLDTFQSAYTLKSELEKNGFNALIGTIENDPKFYVFVDSDNDGQTANNNLASYKANEILKDAFVLEVD